MPAPRTNVYIAEDLAGSASEQMIILPFLTVVLQVEVPGYLSRLIGMTTEIITAGTLDVRMNLNGVGGSVDLLEFTTVFDRYVVATFGPTDYPLAVGDRVGFSAITDSFTPTTTDLILIAEIVTT